MTKSDVLNYLSKNFQEFHNKYNVEKIGLFGSYARDEETQDSDVDIFVQMHPKLLDMIAIKQLIEEDLHLKVDIVRLYHPKKSRQLFQIPYLALTCNFMKHLLQTLSSSHH